MFVFCVTTISFAEIFFLISDGIWIPLQLIHKEESRSSSPKNLNTMENRIWYHVPTHTIPSMSLLQGNPSRLFSYRDWMNRNNTLLFALHRILIFWFTIYFINSNKFLYKIFDYINWGKKILLYLLRLILRQENHQNRIMVHWKLHIHHFWCALEIRNNVSLFKKITFWVSAYC